MSTQVNKALVEIHHADDVSLVIAAMQRHPENPSVAETGCGTSPSGTPRQRCASSCIARKKDHAVVSLGGGRRGSAVMRP